MTIQDVARPFDGLDAFSSFWVACSQVSWNGSPQEWSEESTVALTVSGPTKQKLYLEIDLQSKFPAIGEALAIVGVAASEANVEIRLRRPLLKINRPIFSKTLAELLGVKATIDLLQGDYVDSLDVAACNFELIVALASTIQSRPGHVSQAGTWLARGRIHVEPEHPGDTGFRYEKLTDEVRRSRKIHSKSLYFIEHQVGLHEADSLASAATIYVDERYFKYLNSAGRASVQRWEQTRFVVALTAEVIAYSLSLMKSAGAINMSVIDPASPLRRVIRDIAAIPLSDHGLTTEEQLLADWAKDPGRIAEAISDWAGERSAVPSVSVAEDGAVE